LNERNINENRVFHLLDNPNGVLPSRVEKSATLVPPKPISASARLRLKKKFCCVLRNRAELADFGKSHAKILEVLDFLELCGVVSH
jgi:hypothetical protein